MSGEPVLKIAKDGSLKLDGVDTDLNELELKLANDKAEGIFTPISVYAPTNVDGNHIGPLFELAQRFDRVFDAVIGNDES